MFKKLFQPYFPAGTDPSYQTRFMSLQKFQGSGQLPFKTDCVVPPFAIAGETELREKFKSMQVPQTLPSRSIRRLGGM